MSAVRQAQVLPFGDGAEWIPLPEAAALLDAKADTLLRRCPALARRNLAAMFSPPEGGKPRWFLRRAYDGRLRQMSESESARRKEIQALCEKYPRDAVDEANRRRGFVQRVSDRFLREHAPKETIIAEVAAAAKTTPRTLWRWIGDFKQRGLVGLLDGRTCVKEREAEQGRSTAAVEYFHECYRCRSQPSVKLCHELTLRESRKQGWEWPRSYQATHKWLTRTDDRSLSFLFREGPERWASKYLPHNELDYSRIEAGELFVADHHQLDAWVSDGREQFRPWLTAVQDARSRCIVGWHLGRNPHSDAILRALRAAFNRWAIPGALRIDNGKDYTSRLITGFSKGELRQLRAEFGREWRAMWRKSSRLVNCDDTRWLGITGELGIRVIHAIPYAAWSKGTLERWFGTLEGQCVKAFATYCGNSAIRCPEFVEEIRRGYSGADRRALRKKHGKAWRRYAKLKFIDQSLVPTLEEAKARIGEWIELYHRTPHNFDARRGVVPLADWATAPRLRRAAEDELRFLMDGRGAYMVTGNGVRFRVGAAEHSYGAGNSTLRPYTGRKVFITCDPDDLSHCWAWTDDGEKRRPICRLDSNQRISPLTTVDAEREAIAEKLREQSVMRKARESGARRHVTLGQRMRELQAEQLQALRGLPAPGFEGTISPVATKFDDSSKAVQSPVETARYELPEAEDLSVYFIAEPPGRKEVEYPDFEEFFSPEIPFDPLAEAPELPQVKKRRSAG